MVDRADEHCNWKKELLANKSNRRVSIMLRLATADDDVGFWRVRPPPHSRLRFLAATLEASMGSFALTLKHAGKSYELPDFDPAASPAVFKDQIYRLTGVPADKVKVPVKGGMLKDDADLSKVGLKPGQTVMVRRRVSPTGVLIASCWLILHGLDLRSTGHRSGRPHPASSDKAHRLHGGHVRSRAGRIRECEPGCPLHVVHAR